MGDGGVVSKIALAFSDEGRLAVIKRSEYRVELYGGADGKDARPVNITTKQNLIRPYNVCFAPMNHLLITDISDRSIKIYSLKNEEPQLVRKIICYEKKAEAIIQMETPAGPFSALSSLTINLCQLYKVDMPSSSSLKDIENARKGMQIMMSAGIELKAMTENSWRQLAGYADIELPEYTTGDRQKLDQHIAEFLKSIPS